MTEAVKIHPGIPVALLDRVDACVAQKGITRSAFVVRALYRLVREVEEAAKLVTERT